MKFYPRDWRGDQALRAVSIAARGLWMEMICIMHEADPYGHLVLSGKLIDEATLSRMTGCPSNDVSTLILELEMAGVLGRNRKGIIFSRRMIKDENRAKIGRKSVKKRWAQDDENKEEIQLPNRPPNRIPITQKPEARYHKEEEKSSVDKSTAVNGNHAVDPDKQFWDSAKAYLGPSKASMIGQWVRDHGRPETANAITQAQIERAVNPIQFIQGYFRKRKKDESDEFEMPMEFGG